MVHRLGVIGAGGIASIHLDTLDDREDIAVIAVCDPDEERAEAVAEPRNAAAYTDHETMFAAVDLDAVLVCVPPFAHGPPEIAAAENGVDLFVEKPLALDRETAREVRDAIEEAGVLSQVGYMNRYAEVTERARALIGSRTLALIDAHYLGEVPGTAWWQDREKSGGQVIEQGTHVFDLVRYFGGEVNRVSAEGSQRVVTETIDFEDATSATMHHEDGLVSHVTTSAASPEHEVGLTIVGEDCKLELDLTGGELTGIVDDEVINYHGGGDAYERELEAFLDALLVRDADVLRSSYGDAFRTFELTLAVEEALDVDRAVTVGDGKKREPATEYS